MLLAASKPSFANLNQKPAAMPKNTTMPMVTIREKMLAIRSLIYFMLIILVRSYIGGSLVRLQ